MIKNKAFEQFTGIRKFGQIMISENNGTYENFEGNRRVPEEVEKRDISRIPGYPEVPESHDN